MESLNDLRKMVEGMLSNAESYLLMMAKGGKGAVKEAVISYLKDANSRFTALMNFVVNGGDPKWFLKRLGEEKDLMRSILLSFKVMGLQIAQNIVNALSGILIESLSVVTMQKN